MGEAENQKNELEVRGGVAKSGLMIGFVIGVVLAAISTLGLVLTKLDSYFPQ